MGREEDIKKAQIAQRQEQKRMFAQAVAAGSVSALDRFGTQLRPGAKVLYRPPNDMVFVVEDIKAPVDPRIPPGWVEVILVCRAPIQMPVGQYTGNLIAIASGMEARAETPDPPAGSDPAPEPSAETDPPVEPATGPKLVLTDAGH